MASDGDDYSASFTTPRDPEAVYATLVAVRDWWAGDISGSAEAVGDTFIYRFEPHHVSRQRVAELAPGRRVVWDVTDSAINFVDDKQEWRGTRIVFEIAGIEGGSRVTLTHHGLTRQKACFDACSQGWEHFFGKGLRDALEGKQPAPLAAPLAAPLSGSPA